jgi:hypothetical protein
MDVSRHLMEVPLRRVRRWMMSIASRFAYSRASDATKVAINR